MKNKLSEEFKKVFSKTFRESYFKILLGAINGIIKTPVANLEKLSVPDDEMTIFQRQATADLVNEMISVYTLASAIYKHGLPKSLIFINQDGMAIDLLKIKDLNQESAFDELLDNMKGGK